MPEVYKLASPIAFVGKDSPPFLIVHGSADTMVPPEQAKAFYDALKAAGADATLFMIEGGQHNSVLSEALHPVVLEFLDQHFRGKK
jgi:dipeptidyl aminopeptidase/acylaminoacyl peptidase